MNRQCLHERTSPANNRNGASDDWWHRQYGPRCTNVREFERVPGITVVIFVVLFLANIDGPP
jgi:hypothetical protein